MAISQRIIPQTVNLDIAASLVPESAARYIKNLIYNFDDSSTATADKSASTGTFKPLPSVEKYIEDFTLPAGDNLPIHAFGVSETKEVYVFVQNSLNNHIIYKLNGSTQTYNIVYQKPLLNFQLKPEYFIHQGGVWLELIYVTNPETGEKVRRSFLNFTDGYNPQRFICVEDSIATNSFDDAMFPYFQGNYNRELLISMGVPTPSDCIGIEEVPFTGSSIGLNNNLLYNTWQFRLLYTDVWGRPSEHGIISDLYIPASGDCIASASNLARCLLLSFDAPPPHINSIQIEYRNCNSTQWYRSDTLNLYEGSQFGAWWLRKRNPKVDYNGQTNKITYQFCADKECDPIDPEETKRLYNPLPRRSQAVTKVGQFLALSNNEEGFNPFSESLRNKIKIEAIAPDTENASNDFVNIAIYVAIHNPYHNSNQPIHLNIDPDPLYSNVYAFGAFNTSIQYRATFAYKQYFINKNQKGFVGYLAGLPAFAISKQYFLDFNGDITEITDFSDDNLSQYYSRPRKNFPLNPSTTPNGTFLQKFEFTNVPKGRYIFRIANHQIDPNINQEYQKTSTYVIGSSPFNSGNAGNPINYGFISNQAKEIVIDACSGNYDGFNSNSILVIQDLDFQLSNNKRSDVEQGYVLNTNVPGETQYGVELLKYQGQQDVSVKFTDHNGFFFSAAASDLSGNRQNKISGYCSCNLLQLFPTFTTGNNENAHPIVYKYLNQSNSCPDYENQQCNYTLIKGRVKLCNSEIGIPNVTVLLTRGGSAVTDANGNYTIIAYDDVLQLQRNDTLYFISGSCSFVNCDGTCIDGIPITINKCVSCMERVINIADTFVKYESAFGLLSGGTYPTGVVGWDWLDRPTFVQPLGLMTIPSVQDTNLFAPSTIKATIAPDAVFPPETRYVSLWLGEESTIADYVTWIVDSVQFIDNTGKENEAAPTQIKIYYASLIEYNKQNNYNTTVNWGFVSTETNAPVTSDKVQFLLNGDGTFFAKSIISLVKYAQDGQYFLINYTEDLKDLKENAIIRLVRPKVCVGSEGYYEQCAKVIIENQHATINELILNAFDTYYINRQIPVPTLIPDSDPPAFINENRIFGVPFEHNSPSDFWGKGCKNIGRVNFKNPYETVLYKQDEIALSGALSDNGQLNYLNYFDDAKKKNFVDTKLNGITSVIAETSTVLVVGQNDWFTVGFSDNLVRINNDGTAQAGSIKNAFGEPNIKVGNNYGCTLFDKNTCYYYEGLTHWLDTNRLCVIQNDYSGCIPISKNGIDGYIRSKIIAVKRYNLANDNKRYFIGCANPLATEYLLSDKIIGQDYEFNDERDYNVDVPETNRFGMADKSYRGQYSFCPDMYACLQADINDVQLFSFVKGIPYYHYSTAKNKGVGIVYGKSANRIIRIVVALDNLKKKKPLAVSVVCTESLYFADQVLTDTQKSRILKSQFRRADYGYYAPVLCNVAQGKDNSLMDADMLQGTYIDIRFVGDPTTDAIESYLQGFIVNVYGESNNFK